jgi:hypothetical protein
MNTSDCIPGEELTNFTCLTRGESVGLFVGAYSWQIGRKLKYPVRPPHSPPSSPYLRSLGFGVGSSCIFYVKNSGYAQID